MEFGGVLRLMPWMGSTLRRTPRLVLFMPFLACTEFAWQANGSVFFLFIDNFYMSPFLFLCLAACKAFRFGTVKHNKIGAPGVLNIWDLKGSAFGVKETFATPAQRETEGNLRDERMVRNDEWTSTYDITHHNYRVVVAEC